MQKYHKNGRKSSMKEEKRCIKIGREKENESKRNFLIMWMRSYNIIPSYVYFANEALTGLLILISEYGGKTIICNKVIICWWRSWRET